jgi:hypothetical protein
MSTSRFCKNLPLGKDIDGEVVLKYPSKVQVNHCQEHHQVAHYETIPEVTPLLSEERGWHITVLEES